MNCKHANLTTATSHRVHPIDAAMAGLRISPPVGEQILLTTLNTSFKTSARGARPSPSDPAFPLDVSAWRAHAEATRQPREAVTARNLVPDVLKP